MSPPAPAPENKIRQAPPPRSRRDKYTGAQPHNIPSPADPLSTTNLGPDPNLITSDASGEDPATIPFPVSPNPCDDTASLAAARSTLISDRNATTGGAALSYTRRAGRSKAPKTPVVVSKKRPSDKNAQDPLQDPPPPLPAGRGTTPLDHSALHALATDSLPLLPPAVSAYFLMLMTQHSPPTSPTTKRPRIIKEIRKHCKATSDVALSFSLKYSQYGKRYRFNPPAPTILIPTHLPHLTQFIEAYVENFDRGSESTCRSPIDVLLNTCLVLLKGMRFDPLTGSRIENSAPTPTAAGDASIQPNPFADSILVNGEVSLEWTDPDTLVTWSGRIDYAIGIVHPNATTSHFPPSTSAPPEKNPRLPYQAYLLVVEAKRSQDVDAAVAQLFGYLAVLHKLRKGSGGTGSSREVYGVATDGLKWDFLRITEDGVMQVGRRIELEGGSEEIRRVVGGVLGILQTEVEVVSEIVRLVKSAGSGTGSRVPSIERPTLKQHPLEEGGCQVHTGEVVGVPSLGSTLQEALIDVETGAGGDVLVDAAALDIRDTEYVKGNVEENS